MLVELPPLALPAPQVAAAEQPQLQPQAQPRVSALPAPPVAVPVVRAPLPANPVTLPPPAAEPVRAAPAPAPVAAPAPAASAGPGDPRARKAELDYFSLVSAHLNRRKSYPPEAKRAREEGVVTVRFTVDRDGNVSGAAIRRSSGHDLLDAATLDLLRRVAPLPKMPPTMPRDSVTISLPIEYALKTS
jgi:protein TonB